MSDILITDQRHYQIKFLPLHFSNIIIFHNITCTVIKTYVENYKGFQRYVPICFNLKQLQLFMEINLNYLEIIFKMKKNLNNNYITNIWNRA